MSHVSKAPGAAGLSSQQVVWAPEVLPGPWLFHEKKGLEFAPQQVPGTQSQLGGLVGLVGGRGRKYQMETYQSWAQTQDLRP